MVVERRSAPVQLCAPPADAGVLARPTRAAAASACDEEQLYVCSAGNVVSCGEHVTVGTCVRGCFVEGGSISGDAPIEREAAFALLCSR
jgi:hypothetical protein